ncbi:hypothetical protein QQG91_11485 [Marivivens sp. LCG002]|uniref:hypothetical protein n=1 Tax=Marivivens sp. LCG002 TaxID=3051171 RepID=UPI0025549DBF|nr:hypothetical protein [Marivivens sp. LCG002]WIV50286.1 hypothetical protein QQG91_11485 [Marivivens sp. LCG002]
MKRSIAEARLASTPAYIRKAMLEDHGKLANGAVAVIDRFFSIVTARNEPIDLPSSASFRDAASSEPTFRLLLRTLVSYAPNVSTAEAMVVKNEWVSKRPSCCKSEQKTQPSSNSEIEATSWPKLWQSYLPGLKAAKLKPATLKRNIARINVCSRIVKEYDLPSDLSFITAYEITKILSTQPKPKKAITIAGYIYALVTLGRHGGADPIGLSALQFIHQEQIAISRGQDKDKYSRIQMMVDHGSYQKIAETIARLRCAANEAPSHSYTRSKMLQSAAICAVALNIPPRTSDMAKWSIGEELVRSADGSWTLSWRQEKTDREISGGRLWPEVAEILDEHLLCGRPRRFISARYHECVGLNWLTLKTDQYAAKWPSLVFKEAVGIPLHDLRTLLADFLRLHEPETAADIIQTSLGHATKSAGSAYRSDCEGDLAARYWATIRMEIAKCK